MLKRIIILGSTGSIGTNTLDVIRRHPDLFKVAGLAANRNAALLSKQADEFQAEAIALSDDSAKNQLSQSPIKQFIGPDAPSQLVAHLSADIVVAAMTGAAGLPPVLKAIETGKTIALANKETLVMAGGLVMPLAEQANCPILPVDSEHSAIFQSLQGSRHQEIDKIILTASGGALRDTPPDQWATVTVKQVLAHPNWNMGPKVTIDSASLMNKALEIIEAHWLFHMPPEKIDVLIHKESIIHSMVQFCDGSVIAQLGPPDMRFPIQYALTWPERAPSDFPRMDLAALGSLHFAPAGHYRTVALAFEVLNLGGTAGAVFNAANEVAVQAFLEKRINFPIITDIVSDTLAAHTVSQEQTLPVIMSADAWARDQAKQLIKTKA